jgi:acetoacetyl-CoA synthetase
MAKFPEVADSLCVGQKRGVDERVVLFCKMQEGQVLDDAFRKRIAKAIREELSPRHVPEKAIQVTDIPYTLSGKKVEVAVKKIISNPSVKLVPSGTVANPDSFEQFYHMKELQD